MLVNLVLLENIPHREEKTMNWKKAKRYAKVAGLFVLNCLALFFGSEDDREYIVDYSRRTASKKASALA
mgnify:CR=1 FL=1